MTDSRRPSTTAEDHASKVLASQFDSFVPWLLANGDNPLWKTRSVGEEVARVVLSTLEGAGLTLMLAPPKRVPRCGDTVRWAGNTNVCDLAVGHDGMHEMAQPSGLPVRWTPVSRGSS